MTDDNILFEDESVIVINKPAGILVHDDGVFAGETVATWFIGRAPEARGVGELGHAPDGTLLERSGIVHRLDQETSGVMILAKTQDAFAHLKAQFHDRHAKKEYRALVYGTLNERWGTIDRPIGRSASDFRLRSAQRGARGTLRDAITNWECIGTGEYYDESFSYVRLLPKTGRTHQLRVHMKAINHPIVGDALYVPQMVERSNNLGISRLALHAHILELTMPGGVSHRFVAPLPHEMNVAIDHLESKE